MPVVSRDHLALKFRQNWMAKYPLDLKISPRDGLDDSLTSLGWLQNLNIMNIGGCGTPPASPVPEIEGSSTDMKVNPNNILNYAPIQIKQEPGTWPSSPTTITPVERIDYKTNPYVKPPFSYATLICMAMKETRKSKITLSAIYSWITENFMYYRVADPSWQNSIRHNLSLNKCFQKVPRRKDEPGKGGFWRINPDYNDMLENGVLKKRRASRDSMPVVATKRIKKENDVTQSANGTKDNQKSNHRHAVEKGEHALNGVDFSWNTILDQDIDVDGIKIKTEDILNDADHLPASPPMSEHSIDSLDDLLNDLSSAVTPPSDDSSDNNGDFLNLSIQGIKIEAPDWWTESMNGAIRDCTNTGLNSGLSTPLAPSPVPHHNMTLSHPWQESQVDIEAAIAAFDMENLFDNIPSPTLSS